MTPEQVRCVERLHREGRSRAEIEAKAGLSFSQVGHVIAAGIRAGRLSPRAGFHGGGRFAAIPLEHGDPRDWLLAQDDGARSDLRRWGVVYPDSAAGRAERTSLVFAARQGAMAGRLAGVSGCGSALASVIGSEGET